MRWLNKEEALKNCPGDDHILTPKPILNQTFWEWKKKPDELEKRVKALEEKLAKQEKQND